MSRAGTQSHTLVEMSSMLAIATVLCCLGRRSSGHHIPQIWHATYVKSARRFSRQFSCVFQVASGCIWRKETRMALRLGLAPLGRPHHPCEGYQGQLQPVLLKCWTWDIFGRVGREACDRAPLHRESRRWMGSSPTQLRTLIESHGHMASADFAGGAAHTFMPWTSFGSGQWQQ